MSDRRAIQRIINLAYIIEDGVAWLDRQDVMDIIEEEADA